MVDGARRARRVTVAAAVGACVAVAAAGSASSPVTLTVSPSRSVDAGTPVRLTAKARLQRGARLRITAGRARFAVCARSPCVATYRGRRSGSVPFRASVIAGGKVHGVSRTVTVRWAAAGPPAASRAGEYEGRTTQNESIRFAVDEAGSVARLEIGRLNEVCVYPDGNHVSRIGGGIGPLAQSFPVGRDGSFEVELGGPTIVAGVESVYHIAIAGRLRAGTAVGTIRDDVTAPTEPKLSCTTGDQSWVAVRAAS
jgi:hypothetical protein